MIRDDYFKRMVQELVEALLRAGFLKRRKEYAAALATIEAVLAKLKGGPPDDLVFDQLLAGCDEAGDARLQQMTALADLLQERGQLRQLHEPGADAATSFALSLGLHLEVMQSSHVSLDQINKVEELIHSSAMVVLPLPILQRLLHYLEARGRFGRAENLLFEYVERGEAYAVPLAYEFYDRLAARSDADLIAGDLPRAEVEEGRRAVSRRVESGRP